MVNAARARLTVPLALVACLAVGLGLMAGRADLPEAAGAIVGLGVVLAVLIEPAVGLGLTLLAAPLRAWLNTAYPAMPLDPGQLLFGLTLAAWLARGVARRQIEVPRLPWPLFAGLAALLAVGAASLWNAPSLPDGLAELAKWVEISVMAALVYDAARRGRIGWVLGAALASGTLQAVLGIWQYGFSATGPETFAIMGSRFRAYGTFQQPNPFAGYLGLVWPVAAGLAAHRVAWLRQRKPPALDWLLFAGLAGISLLGLVLSFSRGAWLGAALAGLALAAFWPRRPWAGLALGTFALLAVLAAAQAGLLPAALVGRLDGLSEFTTAYDVRGVPINDENYAVIQRLAFWQSARAMADAQPWLGVGLGNFASAYPAYALLNWPLAIGHAHNTYLNTLAETGVLGLAAYLGLWAGVGGLTFSALRRRSGWQRGLALGLLGVWVHLAGHQIVDYLFVNNTHLLVGAYFGMLAAVSGKAADDMQRAGARVGEFAAWKA